MNDPGHPLCSRPVCFLARFAHLILNRKASVENKTLVLIWRSGWFLKELLYSRANHHRWKLKQRAGNALAAFNENHTKFKSGNHAFTSPPPPPRNCHDKIDFAKFTPKDFNLLYADDISQTQACARDCRNCVTKHADDDIKETNCKNVSCKEASLER